MCRMPLWRLYRKNPLASSSEYRQCELDHSGRRLDELFNELVGAPTTGTALCKPLQAPTAWFGAIRRAAP